ncbi:MAG: hypothetical protein MN733_24150 [Nitrososphaera sp.]|nr:hypothetical protein [Nitrososphaera sp.]
MLRAKIDVHDKIAHTAEHAFVGSLQHLLGERLLVRKVVHRGASSTAFITIPNLQGPDIFYKAALDVNALISEGRKVTARTFENLEQARKEIPHLRANEERISGQVRVVEIENHDIAACAMEHAGNLRECDFFLMTRVSRSRDEYEVDFEVGTAAKLTAVSLSSRLLRVCNTLGANVNTVENTAKKLLSENEGRQAKLRGLSREKLDSITPLSTYRFDLFRGVFTNLADDVMREYAGEKIANERAVVIAANAGPEMASIVFARNEKMSEIDCSALFNKHAGPHGSGGGKPHFVTGIVRKAFADVVVENISNDIIVNFQGS